MRKGTMSARYYFHLSANGRFLKDEEGVELDSNWLDRKAIQDIANAVALEEGWTEGVSQFEVIDESGDTVFVVPFHS
jgi:hypothetical protein